MKINEILSELKNLPRQLKDPETEVLVVNKQGETIVIDKKDQDEYLAKGWSLAESATAGATSSASIATVANPHISPGSARGKKSYIGDPRTGQSGTKAPPQPKAKKIKPTDNALDMDVSVFGAPIRR